MIGEKLILCHCQYIGKHFVKKEKQNNCLIITAFAYNEIIVNINNDEF